MQLFTKKDKNIEAKLCVNCGATAVVDGSLMESGGGSGIAFLSAGRSFFKQIFGAGSRKVAAYACLNCSHLELIVEFTDKDRKEYQNFEGPQPDVIERIDGKA